ncbi:MAG TPA: hydroxymethylbilane synthase [Acidimicrobiales bacterium]|nr:hydroxymethylbilane synthase [Acidimicrobiales bacterium]
MVTPIGDAGAAGAVRLATRGSPLALWQARRVAHLLASRPGGPACELVVVRTTGDALPDVPIARLGGQGAFVKEVQAAVLDGRADLAVHSAKDLPAETPPGLVLACVPERADPRDALVGATLEALAPGALVATGSVRRRAQLAWLRPDLTFCDLRGNMATRLERAREVGAGVVALAALQRLERDGDVAEVLDPRVVLPQVGQGALAVECRRDDEPRRALLAGIDDGAAHRAVRAERAFLATLGGGCTLPVGALAAAGPGGVELEGMVASRDGRILLRRRRGGSDPETLGREVARELLDECGGRAFDDWALDDWALDEGGRGDGGRGDGTVDGSGGGA